jgi:transcriptional regulator with XRE-family HTH domain
MEKTRLIKARLNKGLSCKEIADMINMEEYSYRRRETGKTKIRNKEWKKLAEILEVDFDDIFEPEYNSINIHNENGHVNTHNNKIEYYNIPKEMIETQQEYINLLKEENLALKLENKSLMDKIKDLS